MPPVASLKSEICYDSILNCTDIHETTDYGKKTRIDNIAILNPK